MHVVVTKPYGNYDIGHRFTDPQEVKRALAEAPDGHVVKSAAPVVAPASEEVSPVSKPDDAPGEEAAPITTPGRRKGAPSAS